MRITWGLLPKLVPEHYQAPTERGFTCAEKAMMTMAENQVAASPAQSGDGEKRSSTTENVSEAQAVAHFMRMEEANTKASEAAAADAKASEGKPEKAEEGGDNKPVAEEASTATSTEAETKAETETPESAKAADNTTVGEAETKEDADEALSPESQNLDDKTRQKIQKRIDQEVGKRKALEAQVKQLNEKLTKQTQQEPKPAAISATAPVLPASPPPLPNIKDAASLAEYTKQAKETKEWAEDVLDREDIDQGVQVGDKTYTKADIKAALRNARRALEDQIPAQWGFFRAQAEFQQQRQNITKQAHEKFPFLADRNSQEYKAAQSLYQSNPWLQSLPASEWFLGAYIKGINTLTMEEKAAAEAKSKPKEEKAAKPVPPKQKPPGDQSLVSTTGTPQRLSPEARDQKAGRVEFEALRAKRGVTSEDTAKYLERMESLRQR